MTQISWGSKSSAGTCFVQFYEHQGEKTTIEVLLSHVLSFSFSFLFLLHAMYKVMHLFRSVMCELMWTNQTIIAVVVQSALQPFVSNDNSLLLNSDFYNISNKAASQKSSCLAIKLLPF